jgi:hypothetical protein
MELCAGFSVFEGVRAKMGFPQWGEFRKCRQAAVFRMKLRVGDFFGFGGAVRLQKSNWL